MDKKRLKTDLDELCSATEDNWYEHDYYLDLKTGRMLLASGSLHRSTERQELR